MPREKLPMIHAGSLRDIQQKGCLVVQAGGHTIALFTSGETVYALDNRCPHMGFPLEKGTVKDGILTCHWHHARFDLVSGGTFDQWADDVRSFPVEIRDEEVYVDVTLFDDPYLHQQQRLLVGLERNIPLVIAKAVLVLGGSNGNFLEPFRSGLEFGIAFARAGWRQGLTILTCMMNISHLLDNEEQPKALYQGLSAVSSATFGSAPRFGVWPLPQEAGDIQTLKRWFRRFVEVRDDEGAERCIISAIDSGANSEQMADMLFAAATDHRYIQGGHVLDFINKALEAIDLTSWALAGPILTSLAHGLASASRMEESNTWRNPIDLIGLLEETFLLLPDYFNDNIPNDKLWTGRDNLVWILLDGEPREILESMLAALSDGASAVDLASAVSYAAALRIARFHTSNEFSDWDTALHTFTFANSVEQGLRRAPSVELLRGAFDTAMSIYLDRFLNIPPARLPTPDTVNADADLEELLLSLKSLLDRQQQVNEAGNLVASYLYRGGDQERLMAVLGSLLIREDRDFHTIQAVEASFRQANLHQGTETAVYVLVAAARYLAAHAPTVRAQSQTFEIARRLHRGDKLFN